MDKKVIISIACYNKLEFTKQCLRNLYKNTSQDIFDIVIVDNNSTDGTKEWLTKYFQQDMNIDTNIHSYTILLNNANVGFASAHNQAFKECKTKYFLPLNNDTVPLNGWLDSLIDTMELDNKVAIAGCKLISPLVQGIQHAGVVFRDDGIPYHKYFGYDPNYKDINIPGYAPAVTGASMIIRSDIYKKVGGFDEVYKNGWEDIDLCLKVREIGYQIFYQPKSVLYHYEGQTQGRLDNDDENKNIFMRRWYQKILLWGNINKNNYDSKKRKE